MAPKKRRSSPGPAGDIVEEDSKLPPAIRAAKKVSAEDGMGEFEDKWEDEMESDGEIIDDGESSDEDPDDPEKMLVDQALEDDDAPEPEVQPYLPSSRPLAKDEILEPDQSVYEMLHSMDVEWSCLSFDVLRDNLGDERRKFPHTAYTVTGTQADHNSQNVVMVMKMGGLHKTQNDDDNSDAESDGSDDVDDDAHLEYRTIPHHGGVNRVRAQPLPSTSTAAPYTTPYHVATWAETGKVHIWDVQPLIQSLDVPGSSYDRTKVNKPVHTITNHGRTEGFAMDWAGGESSTSGLRLLTGDIAGKMYLTTSNETGFTTLTQAFSSHESSVEDIQWSPNERTVFASCSSDRSIRVWDVRQKQKRSTVDLLDAHDQDVNVISWNKLTDYLIVSGGDEGAVKVWDLRSLSSLASGGPKPTPVAYFDWHKEPITSLQWHPTESSVFAASGADDQVTLWDLSVEHDEDEAPLDGDIAEVPPQLLFVHQGQKDVKEGKYAATPEQKVPRPHSGKCIFQMSRMPPIDGNGRRAVVVDDEEVDEMLEEEEEEEGIEIAQIRRYEDFSTVDWIQDSLHERTVRSRKQSIAVALEPSNSFVTKMRTMGGVFSWFWQFVEDFYDEMQNWIVVTLVGMGIGINAALISIVTEWLNAVKLGYCSSGWWLNQKFCCLESDSDSEEGCAEWQTWGQGTPTRWLAYVGCALIFSYTAARLVRSFAPYAAGSGISEIKCILGGFIIKGFLGPWTLVIKSLALPLAIASGLAVGKEGPSVHVACCMGNVVGGLFERFSRSHTRMREILTAASAAGVAVAFGAPIGGVLFALEEMSSTFTNRTMWRSFVCALVATVTLSAMNPYRTGKLVLFQVSYDRDWHYFEIPGYILIGVFGGLYGAFVVKYNLQVAAFRRKHMGNHGIAEAVLLAAITAVIGYLNKFLRIDMNESLAILFKECEGGGDYDDLCQTWAQWRNVNTLLLATIVRTGLVIVSYGSKVPAGIFVPSMAVGATFGRLVGIISKAIHNANPASSFFGVCDPDVPCITPGTYALLGAAAGLCGVTRMTVTVVVIMFELTGALTYILPTMIVVLVAKATSDFFGKGGIADQMIKFNGYPFLEEEDKEGDDGAAIEPIAHIMKQHIVVMYSTGMPLREIEEVLAVNDFQGFPVVRSVRDGTILGFIGRTELRYGIDKAKRSRVLPQDALCTFSFPEIDYTGDSRQNTRTTGAVVDGWGFDADQEIHENLAEMGGAGDHVDLGPYVDQTPLTVAPKLPLEIVMQLFKRMGPRVILIAHEGKLAGLCTVKDVLRHEAFLEHNQEFASQSQWEERQWEERVGLEGVLEEAYLWFQGVWSRISHPMGMRTPPPMPTVSSYELNDRGELAN